MTWYTESDIGAETSTRSVTHVLKENLQNPTGLLIDKTRDTLDTTTTSETTNGLASSDGRQISPREREDRTHGLCDTLNVVTKDLAVAFGTSPRLRVSVGRDTKGRELTFQDLFRPFHVQTLVMRYVTWVGG